MHILGGLGRQADLGLVAAQVRVQSQHRLLRQRDRGVGDAAARAPKTIFHLIITLRPYDRLVLRSDQVAVPIPERPNLGIAQYIIIRSLFTKIYLLYGQVGAPCHVAVGLVVLGWPCFRHLSCNFLICNHIYKKEY